MKIFVFNFKNYYAGPRSFKILANSRDEAFEILKREYRKYLDDEETEAIKGDVIELDSPKVISVF